MILNQILKITTQKPSKKTAKKPTSRIRKDQEKTKKRTRIKYRKKMQMITKILLNIIVFSKFIDRFVNVWESFVFLYFSPEDFKVVFLKIKITKANLINFVSLFIELDFITVASITCLIDLFVIFDSHESSYIYLFFCNLSDFIMIEIGKENNNNQSSILMDFI